MTGVFVNYRTHDEVFAVEMFDSRLTAVFGRERVFVDHHSLPPGEDFRALLWRRLAESAVLLVLVGERWLDLAAPDGRRLLDREDDYVRSEIREALRAGKITIPILLNGARLPSAEELPVDIAGLAHRQYLTVHRKDVEHGIELVVDEVRKHVPAVDDRSGSASPPPLRGGNQMGTNTGQATQGPGSPAIGNVWGSVYDRRIDG